MRKFFALFSMFMLSLGIGAQTETSIIEAYQIYATAANGQSGSSAELVLNMKNRKAISMWLCTLELPQGFTFESIAPVGDRYPAGYNPEIKVTPNNDGSTDFVYEGSEGDVLTGTDGPVAVVNVNIAPTVAPGIYTVIVKKIRLVEPDGITIHDYTNNGSQTTFDWTIEQGAAVEATLTFVDSDGTVLYTITQEVGSEIDVSAIPTPTKEGWAFDGWDQDIPDVMPENDQTFTAKWVKTYTATFILDETGATETYVLKVGDTIPVPDAPEGREGYTFSWVPDVPDTMPAEDLIFTATWTPITYTATFIFSDDYSVVQYVPYGEQIPLPSEEDTPTREGYHIAGWQPEVPETMPAGNLEFTAQWEINTWTLRFVVDNQEVVSYPVDFGAELAGYAEQALESVKQMEGFTFRWIDVPETMPDWDVTVQGYFSVNIYTATFIFFEGQSVVKEVEYGQPIPVPSADEIPAREGYAFVGWEPEVPETMPADNLEFTAIWELLVETITLTQEYMPFSCSQSLDFSNSGLKAYVVTRYYKDINYAVLEEITEVPQGTGVLLFGEADATAAAEYKVPYIAQMPEVEGNLLVPVLQDLWLTPWGGDGEFVNFVFDASTNDFVQPTGNGTEMFAKSAYLQLPREDVAKEFVHFGILDTSDGIKGLQQNSSGNAIYDLQGRRVSNPAKGIYIINGNKVAFK